MPLAAASYVPSWPLLCQLRPGVGCLHLGFCASSEDFAVELLSVRAGLETQRKRISQGRWRVKFSRLGWRGIVVVMEWFES